MSEPTDDVPAGGVERCPSCGARVAAGQDWCTLCLQPLRVPEPVADVGPGRAGDAPDDGDQPEHQPDRSAVDPYAALLPSDAPAPEGTLPPGVAEAMLAELAASSAGDRPLSSGPLAGLNRTSRLALGCGAALVLALVLVGLLALVGLLL